MRTFWERIVDKTKSAVLKLASRKCDCFVFRQTSLRGGKVPLNFRLNPEKIVELLLHLAKLKPGADKYLAVKLFYLADREHLNRHGRPITQERYVAMDYGPVASTVLDIFNGRRAELRKAHVPPVPISFKEVRLSNGRRTMAIESAEREPDYDVFSKSDIKVFNEILEKYGHYTFGQLFTLTHKHFAYDRAWKERGLLGASPMRYEEMIEDAEKRAALMADLEQVAPHF